MSPAGSPLPDGIMDCRVLSRKDANVHYWQILLQKEFSHPDAQH
jgi:hypothetical protein